MPSIFRQVPRWQDFWFYQKSETLYQMTFVFCERFMPSYGDRTVDQMLQAARSGKQNIVEGTEDGKTSSEMELKLLNVARSSISELRQDFNDYLLSRHLAIWTADNERYQAMQDFTKTHNKLSDYEPYFQEWTAEEMANVGLTLCYQIDTMMNKYMKCLESSFVTEGGIKERMHRARTGFRQQQDEELAATKHHVLQLQQQLIATERDLEILRQQLASERETSMLWKSKHDELRKRATEAYNKQKAEIEELKKKIGEK